MITSVELIAGVFVRFHVFRVASGKFHQGPETDGGHGQRAEHMNFPEYPFIELSITVT